MPAYGRGHRQTLRATDAPSHTVSTQVPSSNLCEELLCLWSQGHLSAKGVQRLAFAAMLDGLSHETLARLGSLGACGQQNNESRDLTRFLEPQVQLSWPAKLSVPCLDPKSNPAFCYDESAVVLPHVVVSDFFQNYAKQAADVFGLCRCLEFWSQVRCDDPHWVFLDRAAINPATSVPMWIHGDAAEFQDRDSLMGIQYGSILGALSSCFANLFAACFPKSSTAKGRSAADDTWLCLLEDLVWSFDALHDGVWPSTDSKGKPFPPSSRHAQMSGKALVATEQGPMRFVMWSLLGDGEYMANFLGFPHWQCHKICRSCNASRVDSKCYAYNFLPGNNWTYRTPAEELLSPLSNHPLLQIKGVSSFSAANDSLHSLEQGPVLHFLGGVLKKLVYERMTDSPEENLNRIWDKIQEIYQCLGSSTRLVNLQLRMIVDPKKPHAKSPVLKCKAAEARHLVAVLAVLLQDLKDMPEYRHMAEACTSLQGCYTVCERASFVLNDAEAEAALDYMQGFLVHYQWLNSNCAEANSSCFHFVPKFHYARHLAEEARFLNPRYTWTYSAEDFIGKMSCIAASCISGTRSSKIALKAMNKYRYFLHLALTYRLHDAD